MGTAQGAPLYSGAGGLSIGGPLAWQAGHRGTLPQAPAALCAAMAPTDAGIAGHREGAARAQSAPSRTTSSPRTLPRARDLVFFLRHLLPAGDCLLHVGAENGVRLCKDMRTGAPRAGKRDGSVARGAGVVAGAGAGVCQISGVKHSVAPGVFAWVLMVFGSGSPTLLHLD